MTHYHLFSHDACDDEDVFGTYEESFESIEAAQQYAESRSREPLQMFVIIVEHEGKLVPICCGGWRNKIFHWYEWYEVAK